MCLNQKWPLSELFSKLNLNYCCGIFEWKNSWFLRDSLCLCIRNFVRSSDLLLTRRVWVSAGNGQAAPWGGALWLCKGGVNRERLHLVPNPRNLCFEPRTHFFIRHRVSVAVRADLESVSKCGKWRPNWGWRPPWGGVVWLWRGGVSVE